MSYGLVQLKTEAYQHCLEGKLIMAQLVCDMHALLCHHISHFADVDRIEEDLTVNLVEPLITLQWDE